MKMRTPPRTPPKMMMSRWTPCYFSFPFRCKDYVVRELFVMCATLCLVVIFNFVLRKFVLVWAISTWYDDCFSVFCALGAGYSGPQAGFSGLPCPESPGSYPESPGPAAKHTFYCVDIMSYASHMFLHSPAHPTVKGTRASVVLLCIFFCHFWRL